MSVESALVAHLIAANTSAGSRIGPLPLPQEEALPAITYTIISDMPASPHSAGVALNRARVQVDGWTQTQSSLATLKAELRAALHRQTFMLDSGATAISFIDTIRDGYEPDTRRRRALIDLLIQYQE